MEAVIGILRAEIERTMALLGRPTLGELDESALVPTPRGLSVSAAEDGEE